MPPAESDLGPDQLAVAVLRGSGGHHAFETCVEQLAAAIRLGVYPLGSTLPPERELAAIMRVSRATLRDAIAALRTAGMITTRRGRGGGSVVCRPPASAASGAGVAEMHSRRVELLDTLAFRRIVEPGAAALAAGRQLDDDARDLLVNALDEVTAAEDRDTHRQCDSRLHLAIATASGSPLTVAAVTRIQAELHQMLELIPALSVNLGHSDTQHQAMVAAILSGDSERASRVMAQHCDDTAALLRGLLVADLPAPGLSTPPIDRV